MTASTSQTNPLPPLYLLDGGLGTTLADQHGIVFDDSTPLWSSHMLLSPAGEKTLLDVQTDFVSAGADVLLSGTYQASFEGFARSGVTGTDEASRSMRGAVAGARRAFESVGEEARGKSVKDVEGGNGEFNGTGRGRGKVALGLGAYGATMLPGQEYSGRYDAEHASVSQLREWHLNRIAAFFAAPQSSASETQEREACWANVDLVAFETLPRVDEILAAREVMACLPGKGGVDEKPFWISCVFPGEENVLPDGSSIAQVVDAMLSGANAEKGRKPWGVGINCTKVGKVEAIVVEFEKAIAELMASEAQGNAETEWPALVLYPDGTNGEVYNTTTKVWEKKTSGGIGSELTWDETIYGIVYRARERRLWSSILVGGCCKVTPGDIGKLRRRIDDGEK